jgi:hypothetical protein
MRKLLPSIVPHGDTRWWHWKCSISFYWKYLEIELAYNFQQWLELSLGHFTMDRGPIVCGAVYLLGFGLEFEVGNDGCRCC